MCGDRREQKSNQRAGVGERKLSILVVAAFTTRSDAETRTESNQVATVDVACYY
jgi:hypothetical protein